MSYDVEFAKLFKARDNVPQNNIIIGKVIETSPIKISIYDGNAFLTGEDLEWACHLDTMEFKSMTASEMTFTINGETHKATDVTMKDVVLEEKNRIKKNDRLLIACDTSQQSFFVINKLHKGVK